MIAFLREVRYSYYTHGVIAAAFGGFAFLAPSLFVALGKANAPADSHEHHQMTELSMLYGALLMTQSVLFFTFAKNSESLISLGIKRRISGAYCVFCLLSLGVCLRALFVTKSSEDVSGASAFALLALMHGYHALTEGGGAAKKT
ncbi:unnamed protein product [Vitrella brassicaformis CCMP3155]|uniref:Uncharacterized protein n=1 Tax=Vitrella brassicaformis (strain CCMP3155) TaxID=1169540 RepID=A0A0G4EY08_VITBC|nr:unnamed protein product [Vitrella brassicaformis CCMP3155]|mmetsp:Transcript_27793/g.69406  ORF Transcript_27793/g.69406 Transcript_27793/m.69406 type:complete len:145 (-) Transcript_27793:29-463(-)|eukprot:CEM03509.1 unnamed protein product [Vitrella brassicaformis CCMP3155]